MSTELPVCRYRHRLDGGRVRCDSPRVFAPPSMSEGVCLRCELADKEPRPTRLVQVGVRTAATHKPPCLNLGDALTPQELAGKGIDASRCGCQKKIRFCDVHGLCTVGEKRDGMACCDGCPDYERPDAPV